MGDQTSADLESKATEPQRRAWNRTRVGVYSTLRTISTGFGVVTVTQGIDRYWYNIIGPTWGRKIKQEEVVPTTSPIRAARFGATWLILERRYSCSSSRYPARDTTRSENLSMLIRSMGEMSMPGWGSEPSRQRGMPLETLAASGRSRLFVSPDRIRHDDWRRHGGFMREPICPPVFPPEATVCLRWANKGRPCRPGPKENQAC